MRSAGGFLGILGFLCCGGCADYWAARGRDLTDCARAGVALGVGLLAEVEATSFVHPTVGLLDITFEPRFALRWDPRPSRPQGEVRTAAMPTLLVGWPFYGYYESKSGYDDSHPYLRGAIAPWILMGTHHIERVSHSLFGVHRLIPNPRLFPAEDADSEFRLSDHTWLATSVTLLFVRCDVGINPLEVLDFLTGWFALDLSGDDRRGAGDGTDATE